MSGVSLSRSRAHEFRLRIRRRVAGSGSVWGSQPGRACCARTFRR
ncbi:hypothetical protein L842_4234 [Mycobacterium intracellulare MIN_052511_1280]|nr:hypothetical protein L842_4234 [Mycobacterium intracellulare MIN_052511_1280]